jgi:hypothetical protein
MAISYIFQRQCKSLAALSVLADHSSLGGGVTVFFLGLSGGVVGQFSFGVTQTYSTTPHNLGQFVGFTDKDFLAFLLRRPCN